jgi:hypothetical protein
LKVFEGDKLREEQVDLPEDPAAAPVKNGDAKPAAGWKEFFQKTFQHVQGSKA